MAINFPSPATPNQTHTHNGLTWKYDGTTWILQTTVEAGATTFTGLTDTPSSYSGQAGKWIKVNSTPDGLEFTDEPTGSDTTYELKTNLVSSNVNLKLDASGSGTDDDVLITAGSNITFSSVTEGGFTITASSGTATISDGDYGDITVSSSGSVWSIDDNTVGPDELKDTSVSAGTYTNPSITVDAQGRLTSATTGSATPLTLGASVTDIFDLPSTTLNADDPGDDRIVFWDDSSGKLTHLDLGTNLSISGTTLNATISGADNDTTYDLITSSSGSNVVLTLDASAGDDDPITITAGNNITLTENGSGTGFTITSTASGGSGPTTEEIQDIVGAMFSNNTETRITATYQDGDGTIDLVVQDMTSTGSDNYVDGMSLSGTDLVLSRTGSLSNLTQDLSSLAGGGGASAFTDLSDTPSSHSNNKWLKSSGGNLIWEDEPSGTDTTYTWSVANAGSGNVNLLLNGTENTDGFAESATDYTVKFNAGTGLTHSVQNQYEFTMNLDNTAVTPGTYTNADIIVDQQGRITAAQNGSSGGSSGSGGMYRWTTTGSTTWTVPSGFTTFWIICIGAGGGSGGARAQDDDGCDGSASGGGGGGGMSQWSYNLTAGNSYSVTVGTGGNGGTSSGGSVGGPGGGGGSTVVSGSGVSITAGGGGGSAGVQYGSGNSTWSNGGSGGASAGFGMNGQDGDKASMARHSPHSILQTTIPQGGMSAWGGSSYGEGAKGAVACDSDVNGNSGSNGCVMIFGF